MVWLFAAACRTLGLLVLPWSIITWMFSCNAGVVSVRKEVVKLLVLVLVLEQKLLAIGVDQTISTSSTSTVKSEQHFQFPRKPLAAALNAASPLLPALPH